MRALRVAKDIVPIAEFKARASEVVRELRRHGRPLIVTQNGRPAAVLLAPEDFDLLASRARLLLAVEEGLADIEHGRIVSDVQLRAQLDAEFGKLPR